MTVRQIVDEFNNLSPAEQDEVRSALNRQISSVGAGGVRYADTEEALKLGDKIFLERAELFKKLAQ